MDKEKKPDPGLYRTDSAKAVRSTWERFTFRVDPAHPFPDYSVQETIEDIAREPPAKPPDIEPGDTVGNSRIVSCLGGGTSSSVWLGRNENLHTTTAVKILHHEITDAPAPREFLDEARLIAQINHRNIVRVFNCGQYQGRFFIEMEYIEGVDLDRILDRYHRLSETLAFEGIICASLGLGHAHRRNLLHRDVKPANIMVTRRGEIKLTDFGLAVKLAEGGTGGSGAGYQRVCGTPVFMAPEMILPDYRPSTTTDIYALGITLFRMLTGVFPFQGQTVSETLRLHATAPIPKPSDYIDCSRAVDDIVARMLQKRPADRYQDCRLMFGDMLGALDGHEESSLEESWGSGYYSPALGKLCSDLLDERDATKQ